MIQGDKEGLKLAKKVSCIICMPKRSKVKDKVKKNAYSQFQKCEIAKIPYKRSHLTRITCTIQKINLEKFSKEKFANKYIIKQR